MQYRNASSPISGKNREIRCDPSQRRVSMATRYNSNAIVSALSLLPFPAQSEVNFNNTRRNEFFNKAGCCRATDYRPPVVAGGSRFYVIVVLNLGCHKGTRIMPWRRDVEKHSAPFQDTGLFLLAARACDHKGTRK